MRLSTRHCLLPVLFPAVVCSSRQSWSDTAHRLDSSLKAAIHETSFVTPAGSQHQRPYTRPCCWRTTRSTTRSADNTVVATHRGGGVLFISKPSSAAGSLLRVALPATTVSMAMWLALVLNIRARVSQHQHQQQQNAADEKSNKKEAPSAIATTNEIAKHLRQHRLEKLACLQASWLPVLVIFTATCFHTRCFPWHETLWKYGPSATAIGLTFGYWTTEIVMDTALDECTDLKLHASATVSVVLQLLLIIVLTTHCCYDGRLGHMVLWLNATETLISTAGAKTIDHPVWIGIAIAAAAFMAVMAWTGLLAPLPDGVPVVGAVSYLVVTVLASTAYQWLQNSPSRVADALIGNVLLARACLCCLSMWLFRTPPSWILFDAINSATFFGLKTATDTVALWAVQGPKTATDTVALWAQE